MLFFYCPKHKPHCAVYSPGRPAPTNTLHLPFISIPHLASTPTTHTHNSHTNSFRNPKLSPSQIKSQQEVRWSKQTCTQSTTSLPLRPSRFSPAQPRGTWSWPRLHHTGVLTTALSLPMVPTSRAKPQATLVGPSPTWLSAPRRRSPSWANQSMEVDHAKSLLPPTHPRRRAPNGWSFTPSREVALQRA